MRPLVGGRKRSCQRVPRSFQCFPWHVLLQYRTVPHEHFSSSLPAGRKARRNSQLKGSPSVILQNEYGHLAFALPRTAPQKRFPQTIPFPKSSASGVAFVLTKPWSRTWTKFALRSSCAEDSRAVQENTEVTLPVAVDLGTGQVSQDVQFTDRIALIPIYP